MDPQNRSLPVPRLRALTDAFRVQILALLNCRFRTETLSPVATPVG